MDSIFGIGTQELFVILIIAGIVMGPERIAKAARWLGQTTASLQNISRGFMNQLRNELDDAEAADIKDMLSEMRSLQKEVTDLRQQVVTTTTASITETKELFDETIADGKDALDFSIQPPTMEGDTEDKGKEEGVRTIINATENSILPPTPPIPETNNSMQPPKLPNVIDIEDDLED